MYGGDQNPNPNGTTFCAGARVPDVITDENFGDDRLGFFGHVGVKFHIFPLTFAVALKTRWHYRASV